MKAQSSDISSNEFEGSFLAPLDIAIKTKEIF